MIVFGRPEGRERLNSRRYGCLPESLVSGNGRLRLLLPCLIYVENRRAVACADIISLAIECRRVVDAKEIVEKGRCRCLRPVEADPKGFGMAGMKFVRRVLVFASGIAYFCVGDAGLRAKKLFHAPETSAGDYESSHINSILCIV